MESKHECLQVETQICLQWQAVWCMGTVRSVCGVPVSSARRFYLLNILQTCHLFYLVAPSSFQLDFCNPGYSGREMLLLAAPRTFLGMAFDMGSVLLLPVCLSLFSSRENLAWCLGTQEIPIQYILNECCLLASCLVPLIPVLPSSLPSRVIFSNTQWSCCTSKHVPMTTHPLSSFLGAFPTLFPLVNSYSPFKPHLKQHLLDGSHSDCSGPFSLPRQAFCPHTVLVCGDRVPFGLISSCL